MPNGIAPHKLDGKVMTMIMAILAIAYILVADVTVPLVKSLTGVPRDNTAATVNFNGERISRLEAIVERLVDIPSAVARQTEAIDGLKIAVEKQGEKLDRHIARGPE